MLIEILNFQMVPATNVTKTKIETVRTIVRYCAKIKILRMLEQSHTQVAWLSFLGSSVRTKSEDDISIDRKVPRFEAEAS